ncbi:MAG: ATPase, partial [Chlorobi bacterium]|nr:ATPase [Chlorobiota bacterium]
MAWLDELKLNADARVAVIHLATIDEEDAMRALAGWSQSGEWPKGMGLITWDIGDQFRHLREPAATFSKL